MTESEALPIFQRLQAVWHNAAIPQAAFAAYYGELRDLPAPVVSASVEALIRDGSPHVPLAGQIRRKAVELELDAPPWVNAIPMLRAALKQKEEFKTPERCIDGNEDCDGDGWRLRQVPFEVRVRTPCACVKSKAALVRIRTLREQGRKEPCRKKKCGGEGFIDSTETVTREVGTPCSCRAKLRDMRTPKLNPVLREFVRLVGWDEIRRMLLGDSTLEAQMRNKYAEHVKAMVEGRGLVGIQVELPKIERANRELGNPAGVPMPTMRQIPAA